MWVKINDKWREGERVAEAEGMNKKVMPQGQSSITLVPWEQEMILSSSSVIPDAPDGEAICCQDNFCFWNLTRSNRSLQTWMALLWETFGHLVTCEDGLDQLLMTEWDLNDTPVSFDSFSGYIYYCPNMWVTLAFLVGFNFLVGSLWKKFMAILTSMSRCIRRLGYNILRM